MCGKHGAHSRSTRHNAAQHLCMHNKCMQTTAMAMVATRATIQTKYRTNRTKLRTIMYYVFFRPFFFPINIFRTRDNGGMKKKSFVVIGKATLSACARSHTFSIRMFHSEIASTWESIECRLPSNLK